MAQYARREDRPDRAKCVPVLHRREVPLRAAGGQEGEHLRFSPSCQSSPFPSGRAARVKVSDAFHLPPNCYCDRQGIGCHPQRGAGRIPRPHGTWPERRLRVNDKHKPYIASTPAPGVRRKTKLPRHYRKSNFSTVCGKICLRSRAAAYIPGGGDPQEGVRPPSCPPAPRRRTVPAARRRRNPAREARAPPSPCRAKSLHKGAKPF